MKKIRRHSLAFIIALICVLTAMPVTGCAVNMDVAGSSSAAEESTAPSLEATTVTTGSETTAAENKLTEDEAKQAFNYFMVNSLVELNSPVRRYWNYEKTEGNTATFWFTSNNPSFPVRIDIDLETGEAVAKAFERKGGEIAEIVDEGVSGYNFNAKDYIKNPPELNINTKSKDMKDYLGKNISEAKTEFSDLEYKPNQMNNGWINKNLMFDPYEKDKETIEYVRVFDTDAYSVYGVVTGMSLKDAVANAVMNGAGSMIPGDSATIDGEGKLYYFEMADGNTLEIILTKDGTVNYAGVISKNIKDKSVTEI